jgi:hypothetical protein
MLIVSKNHDYYDSVNSYGIDKSVVYQRQIHVVSLPSRSYLDPFKSPETETYRAVKHQGIYYNYVVTKFFIGFCGEIHPVVQIRKLCLSSMTTENDYFYEASDCISHMAKEGIGIGKKSSRDYISGNRFVFDSEKGVHSFFKSFSLFKKILDPFFREYNTPVFAYGVDFCLEATRHTVIVVNPVLKDMKFAKLKNPATAFQEIYMYISGVLGMPDKPMITISDKDKQAAKGHDGEYSFKKPPGKKVVWR